MKQLSKEEKNGIMPLEGVNNFNLGANDCGLFNVSPIMGIQNIPNMTNMAAMAPTLSINSIGGGDSMPSIPIVAALNVGIPNVPPNMALSLSGSSPMSQPSSPNLFTKNAAQLANNNDNNNNNKHKKNNSGIVGKNESNGKDIEKTQQNNENENDNNNNSNETENKNHSNNKGKLMKITMRKKRTTTITMKLIRCYKTVFEI